LLATTLPGHNLLIKWAYFDFRYFLHWVTLIEPFPFL